MAHAAVTAKMAADATRGKAGLIDNNTPAMTGAMIPVLSIASCIRRYSHIDNESVYVQATQSC
jgi:hypothetical protein